MRVGIISPYWLPRHGGAQQYSHRLAVTLAEQNIDVHAFCGYAEEPNRDNGNFPVTRWTPNGNTYCRSSRVLDSGNSSRSLAEFLKLYRFMDAAVDWSVATGVDIILLNHPLTVVGCVQARELYLQLKAHGIKVGAIHHDLGVNINRYLVTEYQRSGEWEVAAGALDKSLLRMMQKEGSLPAYYAIDSPLFFSPDFTISCSEWSKRFIDPTDLVPKLVVHPLMDADYWRSPVKQPEGLETKDILVVNPLARKGSQQIANLISGSEKNWTFRVLEGGYGNALEELMPMIEDSPAVRRHRVEFRDYVKDMKEAYQAAGIVFFPSRFEGYGMTPVESMFSGTPVVCSNYPAILEGVGDGAYSLCPFTATDNEWHAAVESVLSQREYWQSKARERTDELELRQTQEISNLISFMQALP